MKITRKSMFSGKENTMELNVTQEMLDQCWSQNGTGAGRHIQEVMPHLTPDEREFLMTGCTPEEWDEMFGGEDE